MAESSGKHTEQVGIQLEMVLQGKNPAPSLDEICTISEVVDAIPRKNINGKQVGSDILNYSHLSGEQESGIDTGCLRDTVERNVGIGALMSVVEQNGHCKMGMETGPFSNSDTGGNRGAMEKIWGGNNVERNGYPTPVKTWRNLFSVPTKPTGQLQYSKPQRTDGKFVVKPPEEAVMEGIDMWKGCLVGQFLDKQLPFSVVRLLVNKLWGKKEMPDISTTENGLYFFRFRDLDARD